MPSLREAICIDETFVANAMQKDLATSSLPPINLGRWVAGLNLDLVRFEQRPDMSSWTSGPHYRIIEIFTTRLGSWEPSVNKDQIGAIDQWAADKWHSGADWKGAGGDHHLFVKVLDAQGLPMNGKGLLFWKHGALLPLSQMDGKFDQVNTWEDGTENLPVYGSYAPQRGERGLYGCTTVGRSDILQGFQMPMNEHVSVFVVLQQVLASTPPPPDPTTGGYEEVVTELRGLRADVREGFRLG